MEKNNFFFECMMVNEFSIDRIFIKIALFSTLGTKDMIGGF